MTKCWTNILLGHDITATKAHAHMLEKIGVLTSDEYQQLAAALDELLNEWKTGAFTLTSDTKMVTPLLSYI